MILRAYHPDDFAAFWPRVQEHQRFFAPALSPGYADLLATSTHAWAVEHHGHVVALGGLVEQWEGRATAWALLAADAPMLGLTRIARRTLADVGFRRVDCWVEVDFEQGHRWAELLGFRLEGIARAYLADGSDAAIYAVVRGG